MKIVVIGLGSFGFNLVKMLSEKGDVEIVAIDSDEVKVNEIKQYATQPVCTDAAVKENLKGLGVGDFNMAVVSSGPNLEPSILTVHFLRELGVPKIIAKASTEEHARILELVGGGKEHTETIFPEKDVARKLATRINAPNLIDFIEMDTGFVIQEIAVPEAFQGKTLHQIGLRKKYGLSVLAIRSIIPDETLFNPGAEVVLKESDILIVFGTGDDVSRLHEKH